MSTDVRKYTIVITASALAMLEGVQDRRIREKLINVIDHLAEHPEQQGKALSGELSGYRSVRAVGQRYRILYTLAAEKIIVTIMAVGLRKDGDKKDIYALAKKLVRLGLLEQNE